MLSEKEQISALKKLSKLLAAGLPVVKAMELADLPHDAVASVENGQALSRASGKFFSKKTISFFRIGESGGDLASASSAAFKCLSASRDQRSDLVKAVSYPAFVMSFGIACIFFFTWYIVPQLKSVFMSMNIDPSPVLGVMEWFSILLVGLLSAIFMIFLVVRLFRDNKAFKCGIEIAFMRVPLFSYFFKQTGSVKALSDMAYLLGAGVPLPHALETVSACSDTILFEEALLRVRRSVEKGNKLSDAFAQEELFGHFSSRMATVGEESGDLSSSLSAAADIASEELHDRISFVSRMLEPAATIAVGLFAGMLVFSMLSPITSIIDKLQ